MMATGGLFRAPVVGPLMRAAGHIPVDRGRDERRQRRTGGGEALQAGSVVFIYPEGRIGLDPAMWPERPKTGLARLALATGAPVVPVATWGSHEVIAYHGRGAMIRTLVSSIWRRPTVRMHFGAPVDLSDLRRARSGTPSGPATGSWTRSPPNWPALRPDELRLPRYRGPHAAGLDRPPRAGWSAQAASAAPGYCADGRRGWPTGTRTWTRRCRSPFAHRGGAAEGDENSMAAFARAVDAGYRYLETDVHATSDGVAVVFHDDTLDRMLGRPGRIEDLTWADLASLRSGGEAVVPPWSTCSTPGRECRLNIDMKADSAVDPTIEAVWKVNARDRVLLASFSDRRIRLGPAGVRAAPGDVDGPAGGGRAAARLAARPGAGRLRPGRGRRPGAGAVSAGYGWWTPRFVRHAHRLGLQVHVWTIDDPAEMQELLDLGVDGIMTDRIEVLRDVLIARGRWPPDRPPGPEHAA